MRVIKPAPINHRRQQWNVIEAACVVNVKVNGNAGDNRNEGIQATGTEPVSIDGLPETHAAAPAKQQRSHKDKVLR
jgi:hypothetical protein